MEIKHIDMIIDIETYKLLRVISDELNIHEYKIVNIALKQFLQKVLNIYMNEGDENFKNI